MRQAIVDFIVNNITAYGYSTSIILNPSINANMCVFNIAVCKDGKLTTRIYGRFEPDHFHIGSDAQDLYVKEPMRYNDDGIYCLKVVMYNVVTFLANPTKSVHILTPTDTSMSDIVKSIPV